MADLDARGGIDRDLLPALVDDDGETPGGGRAELGRDPERRALSPPRREGLDLAGRASEGQLDLGGVRSENGQDADRLAGPRRSRRDEDRPSPVGGLRGDRKWGRFYFFF